MDLTAEVSRVEGSYTSAMLAGWHHQRADWGVCCCQGNLALPLTSGVCSGVGSPSSALMPRSTALMRNSSRRPDE
jgi:hypothetical protein